MRCARSRSNGAWRTRRLRVIIVRGLLLLFFFLFPVSAITFGSDRFLDPFTYFLARSADAFTHLFACRVRFAFLHLVAKLRATLPDFLAGAFETAPYRFGSDTEFAGSLGIKMSCDLQIFSLLILANSFPGLRPYPAINLPAVMAFVAQRLLQFCDLVMIQNRWRLFLRVIGESR